MKVIVPEDHGATDVLRQELDSVVVRPHQYPGDTYVPLWFCFQALNDSRRDLAQARIVIEDLEPGHDTYQPYWKHCVWSRDGVNWERVPDAAKRLSDTTLTIETPLAVDEGRWVAIIFPLPYSWYEHLCNELITPPVPALSTAGLSTAWSLRRRHLGDSVQGRPLYAFFIQGEQGPARRNLLIVAGQHAVEQSGKMFAESVLRGYHSGSFAGTPMETLLQTHNITVVPLANPDGCYAGRMNSNAEGVVMGSAADNSVETQAVLALIDELQPHILINCHGWGNAMGDPPYEDVYRFSDSDSLFVHLREHVLGCSSSGLPHLFRDDFRLESHARQGYGTECAITEVNYHYYLPPDGGPPRQPTRAEIEARIGEYLTAIAGFCREAK